MSRVLPVRVGPRGRDGDVPLIVGAHAHQVDVGTDGGDDGRGPVEQPEALAVRGDQDSVPGPGTPAATCPL